MVFTWTRMLKMENAAETDKGSRMANLVIMPTVSNKWQNAIKVQTPPYFGFSPFMAQCCRVQILNAVKSQIPVQYPLIAAMSPAEGSIRIISFHVQSVRHSR